MDLQKLLEDAGYETRSYSGRGMYGKECLAIVTDNNLGVVATKVAAELSKKFFKPESIKYEMSDMLDAFKVVRQDQLGYDFVYYFPGYKFVGRD